MTFPSPDIDLTLFATKRPEMPSVSFLTILFFLSIISAMSKSTCEIPIPWDFKFSFASWYLCDESNKALEGIQPTFKQVPPRSGFSWWFNSFSMQAVFKPN